MFAPRIAFIDVETTGSSPERERVTEVGVVSVDVEGDGFRVSEWSSLVNPGIPIPPEIQWLTGISNEMVRAAPSFGEIAQPLFDLLQDAIFVAHNARFDYGFIKSEFNRAGISFNARTLCTVRLSRYLYPDRSPHSLDAIIERFGLDGEARHRALGDARVLWRLLQKLYQRHSKSHVESAVQVLLKRPSMPPNLPPETLDAVPHAPGVYLFYGLNEHPIYIGKSVDMKTRIASHFNADHRAGRDLLLSQEIHRLEWEETAGELGALLRESELVRTLLPARNIKLRRKENQVLATLDADGRPRFVPAAEAALDRLNTYVGPFASRANAKHQFAALARENGLCLKTLALEGRRRKGDEGLPCFGYQLKRCLGACVGLETLADHGTRLAALVESWRVPEWPHQGAVALIEARAERFGEDIHVFDGWCWLGSVKTLDAAQALAEIAPRVFEPDIYRLVRQALQSDLRVVALFKRTDIIEPALAETASA